MKLLIFSLDLMFGLGFEHRETSYFFFEQILQLLTSSLNRVSIARFDYVLPIGWGLAWGTHLPNLEGDDYMSRG